MPRKRNTDYFSNFGQDVKTARNVMKLSRNKFAEMVGIEPRYLANIENSGSIPSIPVFRDIAAACKLPVAQYFGLEGAGRESAVLERVKLKLDYCQEKHLPVVEHTIEGILKIEEAENE
jgi:transcriptional regulator with XRE-family HTH domain